MKEHLSIERATKASSSRSSSADRRRIEKRSAMTPQYTQIAAFEYTPLKEPTKDLRLVSISPSPDDPEAPLVLSIRTQTMTPPQEDHKILPDRLRYYALSYTWGDAGVIMPVLLNGKILNITRNLELGLRRIRNLNKNMDSGENDHQPPRDISLWIDAICINQGDISERDEQVTRMQDIYRDATEVLVWLGDFEEPQDAELNIRMDNWGLDGPQPCSLETAKSVFNLVFHLSNIAFVRCPFSAGYPNGSLFWNNTNQRHNLPLEARQDRRLWSQLARLFNRPWFQRLWIIQELGLAKEAVAIWGQLAIDWKPLREAALFILRPENVEIPPHIQEIFPLIGAHRMTQVALDAMVNFDKNNILTVLHNTQGAKCTDPRDRLYAILGIVNDVQDVDIDYSIPVEEVYRRWAVKRIRRTKSLDILCACAGSGGSGSLPSWVPDLRLPIGQDKVLWLMSHGEDLSRDGSFTDTTVLSGDGLTLSVVACKVGSVRSVGAAADVTCNGIADVARRLAEAFGAWERWYRQLWPFYGDHIAIHLHQTISRGQGAYTEEYDLWKRHHRLTGNFIEPKLVQDHQSSEEDLQKNKDFERWSIPRVHGCQLFLSKGIELGIMAANCGVKEEDEIFYFDGALMPIVLRREVNAYRVIGPCYINGLKKMQFFLFGRKLERIVLLKNNDRG